MKIALIVPGGVDRSAERRVIPALVALIGRLARRHELHVFALAQESKPGEWHLAGARVHDAGGRHRFVRTLRAIRCEHRRAPFDLVHSIWSGLAGLTGVASARLLGLPNLVHIAGGELVALDRIGYGAQRRLHWRVLEQIILGSSSCVTAASAPILQAAAKFGVTAQRVPLGVDLEAWPCRDPRARAPDETARLIHIGTLNRVKDQPTLLRALARLQAAGLDFELDVVGEDILGGSVQRLAAALGLGARVRFHGFLTQRELRPLVERAHIHVLSSVHEAGPLVLLECAALGVPTVGTAVGHLVEWAPDAASCSAVGDDAALAQSIGRLVADEALRQEIGRAALLRAQREDVDHTVAQFERLYHALV